MGKGVVMEQKKLEEAKVVLERFKESFDGMPMYGKTLEAFVTAIECIDKALSQPEIVRCSECKYLSETKRYCGFWLRPIASNDIDGFCSRAERRTDDN